MEPGDERREGKDAEERQFVLRAGLFEPGRHHGDDEVDADEWVHEPQMARDGREVERHHLQVVQGLFLRCASPSQRQHGIEQQEAHKGWQDAQEAPAIELPHGHTFAHRNEQEGRHDHEQRHGDTPEETIIDGYPQAVALVGQHRIGIVVNVETFTRVDDHHQEAGHHANIINKCYSLFHIMRAGRRPRLRAAGCLPLSSTT